MSSGIQARYRLFRNTAHVSLPVLLHLLHFLSAMPVSKPEMVCAGVECIAYQIADVVNAMSQDAKTEIQELRVDGGPTRNQYLMQFQSDILNRKVLVPDAEELSGIGAAYAAGRGLGLYGDEVFTRLKRQEYAPKMCEEIRVRKYNGWKDAVKSVLK